MDEMGRRAERILHGTGETTMSVTEEARRVLGQHMQSARKSWGSFTVCTCGQWRGHRDMYLAHMVDALAAAGVLAAPELPQPAAEPGVTLAGRIRALGNTLVFVSDVKVDLGPLVREAERLEAQVALAARLKCQVTRTLGKPTHVHITWDDVPVAVGYLEGPRVDAHVPAHTPPAREPVEDRLRALAADVDTDQPLTAEILRQFADDIGAVSTVDLIEQIAAGFPSAIQAHTERERRVRELVETIASEWPDRSGVIQSIVARLREALDPTTPDRK
jgi:hypothetical protein